MPATKTSSSEYLYLHQPQRPLILSLTRHDPRHAQQLEELCSVLDTVQSGLSRHLAFIKSKEGVRRPDARATKMRVCATTHRLTVLRCLLLFPVHPEGNGERSGSTQNRSCRRPDVRRVLSLSFLPFRSSPSSNGSFISYARRCAGMTPMSSCSPRPSKRPPISVPCFPSFCLVACCALTESLIVRHPPNRKLDRAVGEGRQRGGGSLEKSVRLLLQRHPSLCYQARIHWPNSPPRAVGVVTNQGWLR
jgi:hypothetical protein